MSRTGHVRLHARVATLGGSLSLALLGACEPQAPDATSTFYDRKIDPIVRSGCATSPSGSACHLLQDTRGNAFGNLSFENYDALAKRQDLLLPYGPYAMPGLLLKALPSFQLGVTNWRDAEPSYITTDVAHGGGQLFDVTSVSFTELSRWISRGATANNSVSESPPRELTPCRSELGSDPEFDAGSAPGAADFAKFEASVNPVLGQRCAAANCHGSPGNSMYLTCGDTPEQARWNYFVVGDYVSESPRTSEILRRALDPAAGGTFHEGGSVFDSAEDEDYAALLAWAEEKGAPSREPDEPGFTLFAERVQPMLVKKGCMQLGCHSPSMGNGYRLRGGSAGHFGLPATRRNYELSLVQIALESSDPNASRMIRKNLPPFARGGIVHRGGALFADAGSVQDCDLALALEGPLDEQNPYCVIAAWIGRERAARMPSDPGMTEIVYVQSPIGSGPARPQDFERFAPGADLLRVAATIGGDGFPSLSGAPESLLSGCGLGADVDVRRPSVSWDGQRIAFSARTAGDAPLRVYVIAGGACAVEPLIDAPPRDDHGAALPTNAELVHNFDPSFSPDGRIVFASTRGNVTNVAAFDYQGPQRSPADPSRLNANLYVAENGTIRQLTFLLDQELAPSFMLDGRLIFSVEKRSPGFYQLAGRRINLDGGDYHPLFAQRASVGFNQFTEVVELADKNLAAIFSTEGAARGAGTLAIINLSLGIDQRSSNGADYVQNPAAMSWPNESFYQHSIHLPDPAATGILAATRGAYLSPSPLPNGRVLVSYAPEATELTHIAGSFGLSVVDPLSGQRRELLRDASDLLWPVAVYAHGERPMFRSRVDEPNGSTNVATSDARRAYAEITYLDLPLLSSLLFQNTRSGRPLPSEFGLVEFWEQLPPEPGVRDFASGGAFVTNDEFGPVYARRRSLGSVLPAAADGSARVRLPGGTPFNLAMQVQLEGDARPTLHHQREAMQFYPGEAAHQAFRRKLFNGLCGGCHGSVSGLENDVATNPDILTRASEVVARDQNAVELAPQGGVEGPDFQ
jgi:WD40-like Beta Propeller Repeat